MTPPSDVERPFTLQQMGQPSKRPRTWLVILLSVLATVAVLGGGALVYRAVTEQGPAPGTGGAALADLVPACREAVKGKLRAPATAQFTDEDTSGGPDAYRVDGVVDAQNGLGVLVRNRYICNAVRADDGWRVAGVELLDWP